MAADLANDKFWVNKYMYHDAEKAYFEGMSKDGVGMTNVSKDSCIKSSMAVEVAKARELIKTSLERVDGITAMAANDKASGTSNVSNLEITRLTSAMERLELAMKNLEKRVESLEKASGNQPQRGTAAAPKHNSVPTKEKKKADDDDDVDLFGSDSEEEDDEAKKIREQRLAEYAAKKSKKPTLIAKSNIILDVKPCDDETDMKAMEAAVRNIKMDGLVWGASKLVPLVYGLYKLQISCVVEDEKISVDDLTNKLEEIEEHVQSVDIAAFNKV